MSFSDHIPASSPAAVNLVEVLKGVGRRKVMILATTALAFCAGVGLVTLVKPVYTGTAQVLVQNMETPFDRVQQTETQRNEPTIDDRVIASQIAVLKSEDLGRRVVAALGLEQNPEFNPLLKGQGLSSKLLLTLGFGSDPALKTPEQNALDRYNAKLNIFQQPQSNVISIEYSSPNPDVTARIANTLAEIYVTWTREAQVAPTERARGWLSSQIDELRKKVADSEAAAERFRAEAGLLKGQTSTLGTQEISELNSQISAARAATVEAKARADAARKVISSGNNIDGITDVLNSASVQRLKEQRTDATRRLAELSVTYLSNHPKMIAVTKEIANIDRQLRSEALKVVASLEEQARIAKAREDSLAASLDRLKGQEGTANLDDVKLKALEREAAANRALLEAMLVRFAEANSRQDLSTMPGLAAIIQNATVPTTPSFPKKGPTVLLITVAGLVLGVGIAFLLELMAAASMLGAVAAPRREYAPAPAAAAPAFASIPAEQAPEPVAAEPAAQQSPPLMTEVPKAPVTPQPMAAPAFAVPPASPAWTPPVFAVAQHLAIWPSVVLNGDSVSVTDTPEVAVAARSMARWAMDVRRDLNVKRIGITSLGGSAADAAVAALALARSLAVIGKRVVLVDLARAGSPLPQATGIGDGAGIAELVSGAADFTRIIGRDSRSPVHLMRFGMENSPRIATLLVERAESVLAALSQAYDVVIVSLGEAAEDTPVYLHKCQGALLVAAAARQSEAASAVQTLLDTGLSAAQQLLIGAPPAEQSASVVNLAVNA